MRAPDADRSPPGGRMAMVIRDGLRKFVTVSELLDSANYTICDAAVKI